MDFDQWKMGATYTSFKLTQILRENSIGYAAVFIYNPGNNSPLVVQEASAATKICPLEKFVEEGYTSLELEFLRRSLLASEKRKMVYLWLKFIPKERRYMLNASIKSVRNLNYLRQKQQLWDEESEEIVSAGKGPEEAEPAE